MTVQEVCKAVMKTTGNRLQDVAEKIGVSGAGTIGMYLKSKSMQVNSLLAILNACGYELIARSADGSHPEFVIGEHLSAKVKEAEDERIAEMVRQAVADAMANIESKNSEKTKKEDDGEG